MLRLNQPQEPEDSLMHSLRMAVVVVVIGIALLGALVIYGLRD
jgi:hypothetical protein